MICANDRVRQVAALPALPSPTPVTEAQLAAAAATFDMLSAPVRLHLVWLLAEGENDVTTLAELTDVNIPVVSQHLAKLRAAGIVASHRDGRRQIYRVEDPHILGIIDQVFSHIGVDGNLVTDPDPRRPPRRPRFEVDRARAIG
jgi:DNA-binding transcriptional ArsR family regulator